MLSKMGFMFNAGKGINFGNNSGTSHATVMAAGSTNIPSHALACDWGDLLMCLDRVKLKYVHGLGEI